MRSFRSRVLLAPLIFLTACVRGQKCYFTNGTTANIPGLAPCESDPLRTICCSIHRPVPPGGNETLGVQDTCLPNGICGNIAWRDALDTMVTTYWLPLCTDRDPAGGQCLDICRSSRDASGTSLITPCDGTSNSTRWCCGYSRACCDNGVGSVELPQLFSPRVLEVVRPSTSLTTVSSMSSSISSSTSGQLSVPSSISASPTTIQSTPSTIPETPQTTNPASSTSPAQAQETIQNHPLSPGSKAGIGIGIALGALTVITFALLIQRAFLRRAKAKAKNIKEFAEMSDYDGASVDDDDKRRLYLNAGYPPSELSAGKVDPHELLTQERANELPDMEPTELPAIEMGIIDVKLRI